MIMPMDTATIHPSTIKGSIVPPRSKSAAHRALIAAALAGGGEVRGIQPSDDVLATLGALPVLGVEARLAKETARLFPAAHTGGETPIADCAESGSTLRFLLPVFAARGIPATLTGRGRLPQRPLGVYRACLPAHGVSLSGDGLPLTLAGRLQGGDYRLPGDVSSQFVTGLLFALPLCAQDSVLRLTTPLESAGYVDMTLAVLRQAGIEIGSMEDGWRIPGGQRYASRTYEVEADWSQAAFLLAAGALGGEVTVRGLDGDSTQGDREIVALLRRFGAAVEQTADGVACRRAPLCGIDIDASQIPDLVPVLAVVAAAAQGTTRITGASRLRLKESDRLAAVADCRRRIGGSAQARPDGLVIEGGRPLTGGDVSGCGDHRIVMSMAVAALACTRPVTVAGAGAVAKSWPAFFTDFESIGGVVHGIDHR